MKFLVINLITTALLFGFSGPLFAAQNNSYTPEGSLRERLKEVIAYTGDSIDMCVHTFVAVDVNQCLSAARDRGVRVRIVLIENGDTPARGALADALIHQGFDARVFKQRVDGGLPQDFIVLDNKVMITGVYNWLAYSDRIIRHDVTLYYEPDRVQRNKDVFYRLFAEGYPVPLSEKTKGSASFAGSSVPRETATEKTAQQPTLTTKKDAGQIAASEPAKPQTTLEPGKFLEISFEDLDKQLGQASTLSRAEKNGLWKQYKDKYVRWRGVVIYKGAGRLDWNRIGLSRQTAKNAETELIVDWKMFDRVMNLRIGGEVTYTGKLITRATTRSPYRLDDGTIE